MSGFEERVRAALAHRAAQEEPSPDLYARIVTRRRTRRAMLVAAPAALTAVAVVAAVAVAPWDSRPAETPAAGGTALRLAVIAKDDGAYRIDGTTGRTVDRFGPNARVAPVASAHDDVTYAYTERKTYRTLPKPGRCEGTVSSARYVAPDGIGYQVTTGNDIDTHGPVSALAYSPDGRRLAYVVARERPGGCDPAELHVRDLLTLTERVWTDGVGPTAFRMGGTFMTSLSWAPDGTHLAYVVQQCCATGSGFRILDVTAPGGDYLAPPLIGSGPSEQGGTCGLLVPAYRGTTGDLTAIRACISSIDEFTDAALVVVDPATGAVRSTVTTVTGGGIVTAVAWDPTGAHALVLDERGRLLAWDADRGLREVGRDVRSVSW